MVATTLKITYNFGPSMGYLTFVSHMYRALINLQLQYFKVIKYGSKESCSDSRKEEETGLTT